jgi:hypothetical protein
MILSRAGFIIVIICFALPWIGIECGGSEVKTYSGFELVGKGAPGMLLLFALLSLLFGFIATWKVLGKQSLEIHAVTTYLSLALFVVGCLLFLQGLGRNLGIDFDQVLRDVGEDMINKPQWTYGLWGTFLGYVLLLIGSVQALTGTKAKNIGTTSNGTGSTNKQGTFN